MKKPTQMEAFDAMYSIAAKDGRGDALFGNSIELGRPAYQRTLIGKGYPSAYLEFPLLGEPCFDLLSVHKGVCEGDKFAVGAGYGHQAMFDWFAGIKGETSRISIGLELDLSVGETEVAGVYLQQYRLTELVRPFLTSVGEKNRAQSYLDVLERMPNGWPPAYVGLFPGRAGTPMRIGGYLSKDILRRCAGDSSSLQSYFEEIGFCAYSEEMLRHCSEFMRITPSADFQFDIMPDGGLGPTFGLSLSFNETKPLEARACMEDGYGARIMEMLEAWGLADDRWRLIAGAAFARHVGFERDDGSEGRFALAIRFNYAKVKFVDGVPQAAKFYLILQGAELEL